MSESKETMMNQLCKEREEYEKIMKSIARKVFVPKATSIRDFVSQIDAGYYDLNPPHQRNVVHNDKWKSELIDSIFLSKPLGHPEFDTVICSRTGLRKLRSLDGKQRCSTPWELIKGKFVYKGIFPPCRGKLFKDWPQIWQQELLNANINIIYTNETLTDDEVTKHFRLKQETKKTSTGETLNSVLSQRANLSRNISQRSNFGATSSDTRMKCYETVVRICYLYSIFGTNKSYDPNKKTLIKFLENEKDDDTIIFGLYELLINDLFELISNTNYDNKWSKTFILPLACLMKENEDNKELVVEFVASEINNKKKFYDDVGGSHSATNSRIHIIFEKFYAWNTTVVPEAPESTIDVSVGMTDLERANLAVTIAASKAEHE